MSKPVLGNRKQIRVKDNVRNRVVLEVVVEVRVVTSGR